MMGVRIGGQGRNAERRGPGAVEGRGAARGFFRAMLFSLAIAAPAAFTIASSAPASAQPTRGFADLADRLKSSVVNISTAQTVTRSRGPAPQFPPGSPFGELFEDFFDKDGQPRRVESLGSGFLIDPKGVVVTNNHVIEGADEIDVVFADGKKLRAELVGRDPDTDLAVLQITGGGTFDFVPWGDSDAVRVGEWVLAIGNPFGLGGSVSAGIISARGRNIQAGRYDDFLQTDAAINRGNSGGPLFNMAGEVIGVNTAIISPSGGSIGLGFSIPSNLAKDIVGQIRSDGGVRRGWLGVTLRNVDEKVARSVGLSEPKGVEVRRVTPKGPAQKAGLKSGDIILTFNGKDVENLRQLQRAIAATEVGAKVAVQLWRERKETSVMVEIGLQKGLVGKAKRTPPPPGMPDDLEIENVEAIGVGLATLTKELRARFGTPDTIDGVLIAAVDKTSSAFEQGLRAGDVIVEVSSVEVRTPKAAIEEIGKAQDAGKRAVLVMINRKGDTRYVAVTFKR